VGERGFGLRLGSFTAGRHLDLTFGSHVRASFREAVLARVVSTAIPSVVLHDPLRQEVLVAGSFGPPRSHAHARSSGVTGEPGFGYCSPPAGLRGQPPHDVSRRRAGIRLARGCARVSRRFAEIDGQRLVRMTRPVVVAAAGHPCLARAVELIHARAKRRDRSPDCEVSAPGRLRPRRWKALKPDQAGAVHARSSRSGCGVRFGVPLAMRRTTRNALRSVKATPASFATGRKHRDRTRWAK
jgi:hypothetical protein